MIHIGTSGFSYDDWRGPFYPLGMGKGRMLDYYAEHFPALEINATYYHTPGQRTAESMVERAAGRLLFAIKAPGDTTHRKRLDGETVAPFRRFLQPFLLHEHLAAVLFQFPNGLHNTPANREFLTRMWEQFCDLPLVFEFRHQSWDEDDVDAQLKEWKVSRAIVDQPHLRGLSASGRAGLTGPLAYFRFHGRNAANWYQGDSLLRYTYTYTEPELFEYVEPIQKADKKAKSTFVFFNNHPEGCAPSNAMLMARLLGQERRAPEQGDLFSTFGAES